MSTTRQTQVATKTLSKAAFLLTVLSERLELHNLAFNTGMFSLELQRPPASTKALEVLFSLSLSYLLTTHTSCSQCVHQSVNMCQCWMESTFSLNKNLKLKLNESAPVEYNSPICSSSFTLALLFYLALNLQNILKVE